MRSHALMVSVFLLGGAAANAADPLAWLPADVNAVARVNVADIYKSQLAKKEGWLAKSTESFIHNEAFIPPGTNQIVIGAELDIADNLTATGKYAVVVPEAHLTLDKLSAYLPGEIEKVADRPVAAFGAGGYVLDAGDGCWLTSMVSSRQAVSRWYRDGSSTGGWRISKYLSAALRSKENTAQFVLAIDLQDGFSLARIAEELKETNWFMSDAALQSAAKTLDSVQGITMSISIDHERHGSVVVDFEKETGLLKPILEKLVLSILQRIGASPDDFTEWKWSTKGKQVIGNGPVSPGGGRRLLSVLDPPSITHAISSASASTQPPKPEDVIGKTTLKYFKSVRTLLDDLQATIKKTNDNHALYFERYARKIDELPRLKVDDALLDYAQKVSSSLRYQAQVQRSSLMSAGTRKWETAASASSWVGPYGWSAWVPNAGTGAAIDAEANQQAKNVRFSEWKQIEEGMTTLRRSLTEKYQIEF
jgi:hypothetical protein